MAGLGFWGFGDSWHCFCNFPTTPEDFLMAQQVKNPPAMLETQETGFDPCIGTIPWRRKCHPLQDSCLQNPMDRGAWWAAVPGVAESDRTERLNLSLEPSDIRSLFKTNTPDHSVSTLGPGAEVRPLLSQSLSQAPLV